MTADTGCCIKSGYRLGLHEFREAGPYKQIHSRELAIHSGKLLQRLEGRENRDYNPIRLGPAVTQLDKATIRGACISDSTMLDLFISPHLDFFERNIRVSGHAPADKVVVILQCSGPEI